MNTQWHDLYDDERGPVGSLEFEASGNTPALELHLWRLGKDGRSSAVWLDENGVLLRIVRARMG